MQKYWLSGKSFLRNNPFITSVQTRSCKLVNAGLRSQSGISYQQRDAKFDKEYAEKSKKQFKLNKYNANGKNRYRAENKRGGHS